jgi:branched-chain amino acid transport system ATP-binding protein
MVLSVTRLCKSYGKVVVADDVSFTVDAKTCLGIIGPNGAGKSSLFHMLGGTVTPDSGSIRLEGQEIAGVPAHRRARLGVARAFQVPQPFARLTVYENVLAAATFGAGLSSRAAAASAWHALERCGLAQRADALAGRLPLLDRKRLELAKGIASGPRLLLLDEVAGGLTEPEVHAMVELVGELKQSYAVIWIEHITHALKAVADRVMVLNFGCKVLEDTPRAAMESPVVREIYMGMPADVAA